MSEASVGPSKPYRHTKGEWSKEHSKASHHLKEYVKRPLKWCGRRVRPLFYHPVAMLGTGYVVYTYFWVSHWVPAITGMLVSFVWPLTHPDSFMKHMEWRGPSFRQGLKIRYRPRRKYMGAQVLNKEEMLIAADHVRKQGDTTVVKFTLPFGDTIPEWQVKNDKVASAFRRLSAEVNPVWRHEVTDLRPVGDFRLKLHPARGWKPFIVEFACKPDLLKRPPFVQFRHSRARKPVPQLVEVTFQDRDPFTRPVSRKFLDLHRPMDPYAGAGPTGKDRSGPYFENERLSCLWVAVTNGGKTNTERCLVYAQQDRVRARLAENWGMDLAFGVELAPISGQFARVEYGEDPEKVRDFVRFTREMMQDRLRAMREAGINYWVPHPGGPMINIFLDEARLLTLPDYDQFRGEIYRDMMAGLTNMRKAGMRWLVFTQTVKMENFKPRDDFPIIKVGLMQRRSHVDMVAGGGAWLSGMKGDLLDPLTPGIYFEQTEGARAPTKMRYGDMPVPVIQELPSAPPSFLDPCWTMHEPSAIERAQGQQVRERIIVRR